jgi:hypothetical protein
MVKELVKKVYLPITRCFARCKMICSDANIAFLMALHAHRRAYRNLMALLCAKYNGSN